MRLLLDTHSFLWFAENDARLSAIARSLIEDGANEVLLSLGSVWEMAIKVSQGKLQLGLPILTLIQREIALDGIVLLPITLDHLGVVANLPMHHRDPFDRLLAAQAQVESVPIISVDAALDAYGITRLW
jgi:PIN domain nuclease of toxin-antitoxin system